MTTNNGEFINEEPQLDGIHGDAPKDDRGKMPNNNRMAGKGQQEIMLDNRNDNRQFNEQGDKLKLLSSTTTFEGRFKERKELSNQ